MCSRPMYVICLLGMLGAMGVSTARAELVGWWRFDETSGTTVADSSGKGNNGTVQGTATWAAGKIGGAWQGNGTNAYIQIPHSDSLNISGAVTAAVWLNTAGGTYGIVEKGGTDGNAWKFSYGFRMESNRQVRAQWDNAGFYSLTAVDASTWTHVAITFDPAGGTNNWKWYINGVVTNQMTWAGPLRTNTNNIVIGRDNYGGGRWYFTGMMDDLRLYNEALSADRIAAIMAGGGGPNRGAATVLAPADKATDIPRNTILSWKPGPFPGTHNVYFGTSLADVNTASAAVLVSQGQDANTYVPPAVLAYGQSYYWRVDEVNASPEHTVYKGNIWSFTVEPATYAIKNIAATASGWATDQGPEKTINNSGLDASDLHGTTDTTMWLSDELVKPAWIQYAFDDLYKLQEMWVWNSNQSIETAAGLGAKDVVVEYSVDGVTWTTLAGVPPFAKASGKAGYTHNTTVACNGAAAKYVKLTINSNWGSLMPQAGLSEVRFFYTPVQAREPQPIPAAAGVASDLTLTWRPGHEAAAHNIYFGTDPNALTLTGTTTESSFVPPAVNLGTTYYWRVDEVNAAVTPDLWTGKVWNFTTAEFITVDDFESYDDKNNAIFDTWRDNYDPQAAVQYGATVGNVQSANGTYGETTVIHGGKQSLPLTYDNTSPKYAVSEATRTWSSAQDWTQHGGKSLSLFFYGDPNNTGQLYLKINNTKIPYDGAADDLKRTVWQPWNIDLAATGANPKNVTKLVIGVEGTGATGKLRFDDIGLYPTVRGTVKPTDPGTTGLTAWYKFDGDFKDSAGTYNGTAKGAAKIASDPVRGQVLSLGATGDAVAVPLLGTGTALTISLWVNTSVDPVPVQYESFFHANGWGPGDLHWRYSYGKVDSGINSLTGLTGTSIAQANVWNHVAVTVSPTEWALWLNGFQEASRTLTAPVTITLGDGLIGAWLGTDGTTISRNFTGTIDDVRFYNRTLSPQEIAFLAGRTMSFYPAP